MSAIYTRGSAKVHANLTSMIDVTFLLIVFFVLVSQVVEAENVKMKLPEPREPASRPLGDETRTVINVVPGENGMPRHYKLGTETYAPDEAGAEALTLHLLTLYQANPALRVNLRADQRTEYQYVEPVMQAVADAAQRMQPTPVTPRVNLVVVREE